MSCDNSEKKVSEVYSKLYHYTTWQGLKGVLESQSLWATQYRFLNDYTELTLIKDKLVEYLIPSVREQYKNLFIEKPNTKEQIEQNGGLEKVVEHDSKVLVESKYKALGDNLFIVSFSGEHKDKDINNNGVLSQWRAYGKDGGYCLVFDTKKLENIWKQEFELYDYMTSIITDVVYSKDEERYKFEIEPCLKILRTFTPYFFEKIKNMENKSFEDREDTKVWFEAFIKCIAKYKHQAFKEENEVRILSSVNYEREERKVSEELKPEKLIKFRGENNVPYIELFGKDKLPIEKIIVGPHKEKELRATSLKLMLSKTDIEINISDIPYIS